LFFHCFSMQIPG